MQLLRQNRHWFRKTRKTGKNLTTEREVYFVCEMRHSIKPSLHSYTRHTTEVSKEKYISWLEMPFHGINIESLSFNLFNFNVHEISQISRTNSECRIIDWIIMVIDLALTCANSYDRKTRIIKILKQTKKTIYYRMFNKDCR